MAFDFEGYRTLAQTLKTEHDAAIQACLDRGKAVADGQATYRTRRALAIERAKAFHGATVAEPIGDGQPEVVEAEKVLTIRKFKDRAAVQRVRQVEGERAILLTMGSWSKSQEAAE